MEVILVISDLPGWVTLLSLFSFFLFPCSAISSPSLKDFFRSSSHKMYRTNYGNRLYYRKDSPALSSKKG